MTGISCTNCQSLNATQALRTGIYCTKCYTYMIGGNKNEKN